MTLYHAPRLPESELLERVQRAPTPTTSPQECFEHPPDPGQHGGCSGPHRGATGGPLGPMLSQISACSIVSEDLGGLTFLYVDQAGGLARPHPALSHHFTRPWRHKDTSCKSLHELPEG